VAEQLTAHDALGAHARDELGITDAMAARPLQAAIASAGSFAAGAVLPLAVAAAVPRESLGVAVAASALLFLALLGGLSARAGGAPIWRAGARVTLWGALAMGVTAAIGAMVGTVV